MNVSGNFSMVWARSFHKFSNKNFYTTKPFIYIIFMSFFTHDVLFFKGDIRLFNNHIQLLLLNILTVLFQFNFLNDFCYRSFIYVNFTFNSNFYVLFNVFLSKH